MDQFEDKRTPFQQCIGKCFLIPQRVFLSLMAFLAIVNAYTMRVCLSVTLTQIVLPRNYTRTSSNKGEVCPETEKLTEDVNVGEYDWSQALQGYILSAFFYGYIITHLPGGMLAERYGAKYVLSLGILSTAFFTMLSPLCIELYGPHGLIILRILMGMGEGTTFPALGALVSQWVPLKERGVLGALVLGGGQIGSILGNTISGLILAKFEWPWVFYCWGVVAILWFIFFTIFCTSDPDSHPFITPNEKKYLFEEMGHIERRKNLPPLPWRSIGTSAPVLSLVFCQIGHDWGFFMMATDLPKYMNDVMRFSVKKNGYYSSLPFLFMWFTSILSGFITDKLVKRETVNLNFARKLNTMIAATGPAIFMVLASYSGCNRFVVVMCFCIAMALMGPYYAGMKLTPLDLSPNYSGTIMALSNGTGSITGFLAPTVAGWMTPDTTLTQWRMVFWLTFVILNITIIPYMFFNSADVQEWNDGEVKKGDKEAKS